MRRCCRGRRVGPKRADGAVSAIRGDHGFTIVEMGVSLLIMAIFMVLVVSEMIHLVNPTVQTEAIRDSSDQLDLAFLRLDSEVRYASLVWAPYAGSSGNDWDIEIESTYDGASEPTCNELKYDYGTGQLSDGSWTKGATTAPGFKVLAADLVGSSDPFTVVQNPAYEKVQLTVALSAQAGTGQGRETTSSAVTFTALNSTSNQETSTSDSDCTASWTAS